MNETFQPIETQDHLTGLIKPKIYSKGAIWGFSVFFTPLFGGILLMQNLKDIEKRKEANIVLALSFLLTIIPALVLTVLEIDSALLNLFCNFACASVLTEFFYKKHFPDHAEYEKKKPWKPLLIGILISIIFVALMLVAQDQVVG